MKFLMPPSSRLDLLMIMTDVLRELRVVLMEPANISTCAREQTAEQHETS